MSHSPEPWRISECDNEPAHAALLDARGVSLINAYTDRRTEKAIACWDDDDMARVVACVNACRGLNPEVVPELVACLEKLINGPEPHGWAPLKQDARELLARVKPQPIPVD